MTFHLWGVCHFVIQTSSIVWFVFLKITSVPTPDSKFLAPESSVGKIDLTNIRIVSTRKLPRKRKKNVIVHEAMGLERKIDDENEKDMENVLSDDDESSADTNDGERMDVDDEEIEDEEVVIEKPKKPKKKVVKKRTDFEVCDMFSFGGFP